MSRKLEVFIGITILSVLILFIGLNILKSNFDSDTTINKISKAIENNDIEYLKDHIEIEGQGQRLEKDEIIELLDILKENINIYDLKSLYGSRKNNIYLKQEGREKFIFDKYILVLKPYDLTIKSNMGGVKVYLDGKMIGDIKEEEREFSYPGVFPGSHLVKLIYEGDYGDIEAEDEVTCFSTTNNKVYLDLYLDGQYVDIGSDREEAILYINGEDTKISLINGYRLGPMPYGNKITISAKANINGNIYESDEYSIDSYSNYYSLDIGYSEPTEERDQIDSSIYGKIGILMENYQNKLMQAINNNNYGLVQAYIEEGSPLMESQKKLVKYLNSKGTSEELIGYVIHDISQISDTIYEARVTEEHNIFYSNGSTDKVSNTWIYTVVNKGGNVYLKNLRR